MRGLLIEIAILTIAVAAPLLAAGLVAWQLLLLPLRRLERARLFLDLLREGFDRGRTPEQMVVELSRTRDPELGAHLHLAGARIEQGAPFMTALELASGLLPASVVAMLRAGAETGDLRRVLPACEAALAEGPGRSQAALNYLLVLLSASLPAWLIVSGTLQVFVLPKLRAIAEEMAVDMPAWTNAIFEAFPLLVLGVGGLLVLLLLGALSVVFGPLLGAWFRTVLPPQFDRLLLAVPWVRRRAQRDFAATLAVLLDGGLREELAVRLATAATTNRILQLRADGAAAALREGRRLPEALAPLDPDGELRWRVANAARGGEFTQALRGWCAWLDARAWQLEQAAAQVGSTAIVILNAVLSGLVTVAVFGVLIALIEDAAS